MKRLSLEYLQRSADWSTFALKTQFFKELSKPSKSLMCEMLDFCFLKNLITSND